jgi:glycosyltransferase involved in cell wall biosynthesis
VRIAWLGPAPRKDQGVPAVATLILRGLATDGIKLDCFTVARREQIPESLFVLPGLRWVLQETSWRPNRWYSRLYTSAYLTLRATRTAHELRLGSAILRRHRAKPYDLIYQFSAPETLALGRHLAELPPLVLHPQVHAAGELRWHRREDRLAALRESAPRRLAVRSMLGIRARAQRRALGRAHRVIAASTHFAKLLADDYALAPDAIRTVPNPVDLERFASPAGSRPPDAPIRLLFVGMLSVRKGIEMVVELSHRLADQRRRVTIELAGEPREWSDYSGLLEGLHPDVGRALGWVDPEQLPALYSSVDALLQPSHYEPFGIAVAEALASGVPVVVSDAVGAAEWVSSPACRVFRAGDVDAFERAVRELLSDIASGRNELSAAARAAATAFAPSTVGARLADVLAEAAGSRSSRPVPPPGEHGRHPPR